MRKKFDDIFSPNGRTDGHRTTANRAYAYRDRRAVKKNKTELIHFVVVA